MDFTVIFLDPPLTLRLPGGGTLNPPPVVFCILLQKSPLQPMMKLYVNSYTILVVTPMLWSGKKNDFCSAVFFILLQKSPLQSMIKLYVNSYTILVVTLMLWPGQKKLIFAHFKTSKVRRLKNRDFCTCQLI